MELIKWNNKYNLGIEIIDQQHQNLVKIINDFYAELKTKTNDALIAELIDKMKDYIEYHFKSEEEMLEKNSYPNIEAHKTQHKEFVKKVKSLKSRYRKGEIILSFEVTSFLKEWLMQHILVSDKEYTKYIKA
ncbi:MAG: bacteriohemerythrin [Bacteroidales bacterium]|nr:bacteriohemerythrin [Bacteroidales bacterium]MBN2821102.1 bacteriohemerythrin [Bacteroidales bacterium]